MSDRASFFETAAVRLVSAYLRRTPFEAGRWRAASYAIPAVRRRGASMGTRTIRTRLGFRMRLDLGDWVDQHIYATGLYEDPSVLLARSILRAGDRAIDVGANVGFFTLAFAEAVGPTGSVTAFEPVPATRARLRHSVGLNSSLAEVIESREEAVGDVVGEVTITSGPAEHSGIASLRPIDGGERVAVPATTMDAMFADGPPPRLIKIDVEGVEGRLLAGMAGCFEAWGGALPAILIEVSDVYLREFGDSAAGLIETLEAAGYSGFVIEWDRLRPLTLADRELDQFNAFFTSEPEIYANGGAI